jgi:2-polyprenyl-3-methyl-5-hydroxy-6-metoxy-1,4-benzoquinol methylase
MVSGATKEAIKMDYAHKATQNRIRALTNKEFWNAEQSAARQQYDVANPFDHFRHFGHSILQKFLTYDQSLSFLEVGCVPGRHMLYFAKNYGYQVSGIDYSDEIQYIAPILRAHNITKFELVQCDFFEFAPATKYDIVFSAGFVEHFAEPDSVFKKHVDLLRKNGILIISLPNLRYGQKMLRVLFGIRHVFNAHNLEVMFPRIWHDLAEKEGLSVLYCNYAVTFSLWLTPDYNARINRLVGRVSRGIGRGLHVFGVDQVPNRYFSPHILLVAKK